LRLLLQAQLNATAEGEDFAWAGWSARNMEVRELLEGEFYFETAGL